MECENKSDTGNNRGDWDRFKITQTVPEQYTGESDSTLATYWGIRQYLSNILGNQTVPEQHTGESDST